MRTLHWPDDPEPQEPDAATGNLQQLQGVLRCAGKVLAPYARGHRP